MTEERLGCCVPYCRRTFKRDGAREIICGKHWRAVPQAMKARRRQLLRRARKVERLLMRPAIIHRGRVTWIKGGPRDQIAQALWDRCWQQCKAAAIEAAGGIA